MIGESVTGIRRDHAFRRYATLRQFQEVSGVVLPGIIKPEAVCRNQDDIRRIVIFRAVFPAGLPVLGGVHLAKNLEINGT
ncbi:hypothetical protein D9M69_533150 [compost metagenome]